MEDRVGAGGTNWDKVDRILEAVSQAESEGRESLLKTLCQGDETLIAEVASLLEHVDPSEAMLASLSTTLGGGPGQAPSPDAEPKEPLGYIGHYRLVQDLRGGMSRVYEAWDDKEQRRVVIKLAREERDPRARDRLAREARADASLKHPNVCRIFDVGFTPEDRPYIVLEFCPGETLSAMQKRGSVSPRLAVSVAQQLAEALAEAHGLGIVHRDIKPENVMVDDGGRVKLLDFGTAQEGSDRLTGAGMVVGTPLYMSPEQLKGEVVGPATDIWSLGVVLYEGLKGEHPFYARSRRRMLMNIVDLPPPPLGEVSENIPKTLGEILGQVLSRDPKDRPDAAALATALAGAQEA